MLIRKNDLVQVIRGQGRPQKEEDRKKPSGRVLKVYPDGDKVVVEGKNFIYRHIRKSRQQPQGGRVEKERAISASCVALFCENCSRGVKVKIHRKDDGSKVRVCKLCQEVIPYRD